MSGWIFGNAQQAHWTQVLHRTKTRFQNPIRQNYKHVKAVETLLDVDLSDIHNLVAFVGDAIPKTDFPDNVLWDADDVPLYIAETPSGVFSDADVARMARALRSAAVEPERKTDLTHVANLKDRQARQRNDPTACPRCGEPLVERTARKTGDTFMGCSTFPACRGTRTLA